MSHVSIINISLEIMHTKLLKFKHKGHCSGNHGYHNLLATYFLSQGSSHNNIVKLQPDDNIRDKKIIFLVLDHLNKKSVLKILFVYFILFYLLFL